MNEPAEIILREATMEDARQLFDWTNSADSLAASLETSTPIPWEEHLAWLSERLEDPGSIIWIAQLEDIPVGNVRLVNKTQGLEVAIYVALGQRKSGHALTMLKKARTEAPAQGLNGPLIARILSDNHASIRLFERAGYQHLETHDDHLVLGIS
jgi:UDP-2,4-diacetamido-2,4,6-trideoxy-beta-L-altropyranose hydrolase